MAIFNSHHYSDGNLEFGHPQNHGGELFAYGSEILRYHPNQFKAKVEQLGSPEEKQLAFNSSLYSFCFFPSSIFAFSISTSFSFFNLSLFS